MVLDQQKGVEFLRVVGNEAEEVQGLVSEAAAFSENKMGKPLGEVLMDFEQQKVVEFPWVVENEGQMNRAMHVEVIWPVGKI